LCYFQALNANYTNQTDQYDGPVIIGDTRQTGKMGAEHLMGLGFVHFAYCGIGDYYWSRGGDAADKVYPTECLYPCFGVVQNIHFKAKSRF